jgi:hypothetical protein
MIRIHHIPRAMLVTIAVICAVALGFATVGVTGMYRDAAADRDRLAQEQRATPTPPVMTEADVRELEALRDLFAYCSQKANWGGPPCAATGSEGGVLYTTQRTNDDGGGDTEITVKTDDSDSSQVSPATPSPIPTKKAKPPSDSDGGDRPGRSGDGNGRPGNQGNGGNGRGNNQAG